MASSTIQSTFNPYLTKKDVWFSACSSQPSLYFGSSRRRVSKKIVKASMTMTEKILAKASEKMLVRPGDNVWVDVDILMTHDVCGPGSFDIFKREFGKNAKKKVAS
ncbi:hypothetical protein Leryth_002710 [Lithospermum erythrorhizon]|nr:hypothetical protein Leryth_002710 [Lithospermum erythrorhizon]